LATAKEKLESAQKELEEQTAQAEGATDAMLTMQKEMHELVEAKVNEKEDEYGKIE
jgi:hypothetical protein